MNADVLSKRLAKLPASDQRQVEALIDELEKRQRQTTKRSTALQDEPFVGMWKDREDLADSTAWVSETRQTEWERG